MENEHIAATGLYYYACDNITESKLSFRTIAGTDGWATTGAHAQSDHQGTQTAWGLGRGRPCTRT